MYMYLDFCGNNNWAHNMSNVQGQSIQSEDKVCQKMDMVAPNSSSVPSLHLPWWINSKKRRLQQRSGDQPRGSRLGD